MTDEEFDQLMDTEIGLIERLDMLIKHDPRSVFAHILREIAVEVAALQYDVEGRDADRG